jgi:methyl-accepting chemotaxis protein
VRADAEREKAASKNAIHTVLGEFEFAVGGIIGTVSAASIELEATANTLIKAADATRKLSSVAAANVQSVASVAQTTGRKQTEERKNLLWD